MRIPPCPIKCSLDSAQILSAPRRPAAKLSFWTHRAVGEERNMQRCGGGNKLLYGLTLTTGIVECLGFAGLVFGFASLVFVLKQDGYFSQMCVNVTAANNTSLAGKDIVSSTSTQPSICMRFAFECREWRLHCCQSVSLSLSVSSQDCSGQDEHFSLVFTIASFLIAFLSLPNGYLFDRFGTMVTRLLGM